MFFQKIIRSRRNLMILAQSSALAAFVIMIMACVSNEAASRQTNVPAAGETANATLCDSLPGSTLLPDMAYEPR